MREESQKLSFGFLKMRHSLFAYINGAVGDYHIAEDIFQETWLSLMSMKDKKKIIKDMRAWCFSVARKKIMDFYRDKYRKKGSLMMDNEMLDLLNETFDQPEEVHSEWDEHIGALQKCMEALKPGLRRLLQLRYIENLTMEQLAEQFDKTKESIYMALSRIRDSLKKCVQARGKQV